MILWWCRLESVATEKDAFFGEVHPTNHVMSLSVMDCLAIQTRDQQFLSCLITQLA